MVTTWQRHRYGVCWRVLLAVTAGLFPSAQAKAANAPARQGLQEVVVSVRDLDRSVSTLRAATGWVVRHRGSVDAARLALWGLPANAKAREAVLGNPMHGIGLLRVVEFRGAQQIEIRSSSRPFDTGGIFNIDTLVRDMDDVFARMQARGFQGYADPSRYIFFNKPYAGAILRGQDGIVFNLLERGDRNYSEIPAFTLQSHITNSTQMVANWDRATDFFVKKMGWHRKWTGSPAWQPDGRNNFSLPDNLVREGKANGRAAAFSVAADADGGSLEIFHFDGIQGIDFSARAKPPNLGLLMYIIMIPDLTNYLTEIQARGVAIVRPASEINLPPYGKRRAAVVASPDGAWMMLTESGH